MNCDLIDIGCHVAAYFDPWLAYWGAVGAFIKAWWWVGYGAVCLLAGAHLGKVRAYGIVTAGLVAIALRYWPVKAGDPAYETGERDWKGGTPDPDYAPPPKPKKRKTTIF